MKTTASVVCGLFCLLIMRAANKRYFSVSGIFVLVWTTCLSLATCGLFGMDSPSWTVVCLACISIFVFALMGIIELPFICFGKLGNLRIHRRISGKGISCSYILYVLHVIAYMFSFPFLRKVIFVMLHEGIYYVREYAFSSSSFASTAELMVFQIFIQPLFQVMVIFTLLDIRNRIKCKLSILITVVDLVIYTTLFAGRYILFQTLVYTAFIMYDSEHVKNIYSFMKYNRKTIGLCLFIVAMLLIVSSLRSSSSVIRSAYIYFCGSFTYLSKLIEQNVGVDLYLAGRAQWGFVFNFLYLAIALVLGIEYDGSNHIITQLTQYMIPIGQDIKYNSLGTMLHDFIADYGELGSIGGVVFFALLCNYIERVRRKYEDGFTLGLYYYTLFVVVNSVLGYSLRAPAAFTTILLIFIFGSGKSVERRSL